MKSHLDDPRAFELGETQVRAGRAAARTRFGLRYWIAYVSNVADAGRIRVEMIPNPMSEAGEAVLELLGEGLRFGFRFQPVDGIQSEYEAPSSPLSSAIDSLTVPPLCPVLGNALLSAPGVL